MQSHSLHWWHTQSMELDEDPDQVLDHMPFLIAVYSGLKDDFTHI